MGLRPQRCVDRSGPLTLDDLIDLHFLLELDELFLAVMRHSLDEPPVASGTSSRQ